MFRVRVFAFGMRRAGSSLIIGYHRAGEGARVGRVGALSADLSLHAITVMIRTSALARGADVVELSRSSACAGVPPYIVR